MTTQATNTTPAGKFKYFPAPKYAPVRDHSYCTEGDEIARLMKLMGREMMPWQKFVVDIATEYKLVEGRRHYHYKKILITVPRQSGKTTLMGPVKLHRIMTRPGITAWSTAQTGKDAGKRMKDLIKFVLQSPIASIFKKRESNGSEGLEVKKTGSSVTRFSPVVGALHGETPHLVDFDEIWKYTEDLGDSLLGGVGPAQITIREESQIWMISTRGTAASVFMNNWVRKGRDGTEAGLAYFEWSMPDGMDPDDPKTWWEFHPALGNTITEEALREEMYGEGMTHAERMRGYMNVLTEAEDPIITPEAWKKLAIDPSNVPDTSEVVISYEVAPGNKRAAVVANWRDDAGFPCSRVLHSAPGTIWLPQYLRKLHKKWNPKAVAADDGGPVRRITDMLKNPPENYNYEPIEVVELGMRDFGTACGSWLTAARDDKTLKQDGSQVFANAVAHSVLRSTNGVERIDRDKSTGPVCEVIASAVGLFVYDHPEVTVGTQLFV